MITLRSEELIAINSIIDDNPIYGITLIDDDIPEQERVAQVMRDLEKKEIIANNQLTDKGLVLTKLLYDYKKSETYVFLHNLRIALTDENHVIIIEKRANETFYITRSQKITLEKQWIRSAPFLQKETICNVRPFTNEKISQRAFEDEIDSKRWTEIMAIQKHVKHRIVINEVYYMDKEHGYCYRYDTQERIEKTPRDIRMDLMRLLEIGGITYA